MFDCESKRRDLILDEGGISGSILLPNLDDVHNFLLETLWIHHGILWVYAKLCFAFFPPLWLNIREKWFNEEGFILTHGFRCFSPCSVDSRPMGKQTVKLSRNMQKKLLTLGKTESKGREYRKSPWRNVAPEKHDVSNLFLPKDPTFLLFSVFW